MTAASQLHTLIIGASSGIGAALANRLKAEDKLSLIARRHDRLQAIASTAAHTEAFVCDVSNSEKLLATIKDAVGKNGKIDRLIYCAGKQMIKPLRSMSCSELEDIVDVNLMGALVSASAFASTRLSNSNAVYLAISSIAAQRAEPGIIAYSAAKAGLSGLIQGLARECAPKRAIAIAPGWLDTEMTQSLNHIYTADFRSKLASSAPLGITTVDEIVELAAYLLSNSARSITGQTITMDSGAVL